MDDRLGARDRWLVGILTVLFFSSNRYWCGWMGFVACVAKRYLRSQGNSAEGGEDSSPISK